MKKIKAPLQSMTELFETIKLRGTAVLNSAKWMIEHDNNPSLKFSFQLIETNEKNVHKLLLILLTRDYELKTLYKYFKVG